jgi:hypothetical protein
MNVILTNDYYNSNWIYTDSINFLLNNSSTPIFNSFEILARVSMSGCEELVHHLETVDGLTPSSSESHLLGYPPRYYQHRGFLPSFVPLALISGDLHLAYISNL